MPHRICATEPPQVKKVHQQHGTSEYSLLLGEIPSLKKQFGTELLESLDPAIYAFRKARKEALALYPGVSETLKDLRKKGVVLVAYTESKAFYTSYRFRKLGLDQIFDFLYSPPDHALTEIERENLRLYNPSHYEFAITKHRFTPENELKPNPHILASIINEVGASSDQVVYLGDSEMKDIAMAQDAGILDVHAAYGQAQDREQYELLKEVTHWTDQDVKREQEIQSRKSVIPSISLPKNFTPIKYLF
ncbi:HAD family hydrolase [Palleronia rufa]|uniref:HAD family hydrolase n=1 Tax=Palleronia rufa TaxID=1530186 RepID=UPI0009DE4231|nr:HAD family hydrolase [Palleronia rufa]